MKNRFTTLDLIAILPEIRERLVGMRINQVYDVDSKTFIFRFSKATQEKSEQEESLKQMLIIESGIRIHMTEFNWPKNDNPSGFTMKLRKHIRNKRLESITQIGIDRIVDLQFGTNEFTSHVIIELYSKGNVILTDKDYTILSLIRFYKDNRTNINIAVRETYPINKQVYIADDSKMNRQQIEKILSDTKETNFKKLFNPHFLYGPTLLEHSLLQFKDVNANKFMVSRSDIDIVEKVFQYAESQVEFFRNNCSKGYIIQKMEKRANSDEMLTTYDEFHPYLFAQFVNEKSSIEVCETFNKAIDQFFSKMEGQKIESKTVQQEKQALKKLDAIKKDHVSRLENLAKMQEIDNRKAQLIESNIELVDKAISVLRSSIAAKYSWEMISELVRDAQDTGDLIATKIKDLKLDKNCFTMILGDPFEGESSDSKSTSTTLTVDIDIGLSAYANARRYYDHRKDAAKKEQKTIDHSEKAFKNVERKVKQQLKETTIKTNIVMARKILWFEKFYWFISSEGFLVIAGRDAQQNEMIVKRYLSKDDIYVHADIHGATSVVIKNYTEKEVPPKTLNEAANMAICFSASWDAKVVTAAYWVFSHQVQKTAPSGQYLSVGSFMIRGKKNYIPVQNLILGFGFVFRIDEESMERREKQINDEEKEWKGENVVEFPDTTISLVNEVEETQSTAQLDSEYTIVTTGDVKKKAKVITQKALQKKTIQQTKNIKKAEKRKAKKGNKDDKCVEEQLVNNSEIKLQDESQIQQGLSTIELEQSTLIEDEPEIDKLTLEDTEPNDVQVEENEKEASEDDNDDDEAQLDPKKRQQDAKKLIDSLVSNPTADDHLLYAIPVCGPYISMHNYKHKIKIIPGNTKRGKAAKTALMIFLKDKLATEREKDLLKAIKDQDVWKGMPGQVKIVTRNLNK
ncbi:hypothetical protein RDWZM_008427 [Blomia tropicalis]|uniref:Uncharacterized protein n=1 Tax=Blomia tropicalis TaxID=40697 RepID=A0A9Q0RKC0_BLOTA|nr:hypothetical protein BLOT_010969 [Blomia tropicalis]KAJ6217270.1 hypothetical protein RDWZM_008427 [Blomia tropicalis]